jgi:AcrR family transcriptional regulator
MRKNRSTTRRGDTKAVDRRVAKTRELLEAALLSLIKEKAFDSISVQDIIERANVGRATFYLHYDNKEDLLGSGFSGLEAELRQCQTIVRQSSADYDDRLFAFSHYLLEHAHKHREVIPAMIGKRGGVAIQHVLRKLLTGLIREEVRTMSAEKGGISLPGEATVEFLANGLFGILVWWLNGRMRLSVDQVNGIFRRLAIPVLKASAEHSDRII